jgi:two-component system response regulator QseB
MNRILIAEDEPKIAAFLQKGLNRSGFVTEVVSSGNTVLERVTSNTFDLLLLDLGLPGKDGSDIFKEMQQQGSQLPVIVVTARSIDPEDATLFQQSGTEIVSKPFRMRDLIQKVKARLDRSAVSSDPSS